MNSPPWLAVAVALAMSGGGAVAYETDPYTSRHIDIADSAPALDRQVNAALDELAASWRRGADEGRFAKALYRKLGGRHWVDKLERWAIKSPEVEKLPVTRRQSIYAQLPMYATRVAGIFGFGPTIKVNGALIGTDKLGHFLSQGWKFYRRYRRMGDEARAAKRSVTTEKAIFGRLTTGAYSNADIVANYEGYRFYRSLFEAGVVPGKGAIFVWEAGKPVRRRNFAWADHVNAFWDEAINPNAYDRLLLPLIEEVLLGHCARFKNQPERYAAPDADALFRRYQRIGVVDTRDLRPDRFLEARCEGAGNVQAAGNGGPPEASGAGLSLQRD